MFVNCTFLMGHIGMGQRDEVIPALLAILLFIAFFEALTRIYFIIYYK